jgi:LysM repeat protein
VLAGSGGVPASAAASLPAHARATVVVRPGDTLWSIAEVHHGTVPLSHYVDALVDLNGGATIQVGQSVVLP